MANTARSLPTNNALPNHTTKTLGETLSSRLSKELVIALSGPIGCGIKQIKHTLKEQLTSAGYNVIDIRISDLMKSIITDCSSLKDLKSNLPTNSLDNYERISKLQVLGNELRDLFGSDIGAQLAVREIAVWRGNHSTQEEADELAISQHTAFIIDQLKHPEESKLLSTVYKNIFYQIGILTTETEKLKKLKDIDISRSKAIKLIEDDRHQEIKSGQQLEKTLSFSDYFLSNTSKNLPTLKVNIDRFISLMHGVNGITPTKDEVGMYTAYSSSLRSACLSRQVGAAICDDDGNVLAVGRNDVPKYSGGLYTIEDGENDHRCINHGSKCHNTEHINKLKNKIKNILEQEGNLEPAKSEELIKSIAENTPIGSLIEYSRAIHAEMDAITSLARSIRCSSKDTTIFTTTFPCHNCARHIVAAGIKRVVFIEPYAKSLAIDLHGDSICWDEESDKKLHIDSFEGVAPTKYQIFFLSKGKRKNSTGRAITIPVKDLNHIASDLVAKYTDTEKVVTEILTKALEKDTQPLVNVSIHE